MTFTQYILGLGLVSITIISTTIIVWSQININPEDRPVIINPEILPRPLRELVVVTTEYTDWGHVTSLETGEAEDSMSIVLDPSVPFVNPPDSSGSACKNSNAGYALDPKDAGIKVHEAALLSAFVARKKVRLLIRGCFFSRPRVIAVGLTD